MTTVTKGWTPRERALLALCVASLGISLAGYFDFGGSAGGAPGRGGVGSSVSSGEIRDGTIRGRDIGATITSADIIDGSIRAADLGIYQSAPSVADVPAALGSQGDAFANCDPGDVAISGGIVNSNAGTVGLTRFENFYFPRGPAWYVLATRVGQSGPEGVTVEAVCLNN